MAKYNGAIKKDRIKSQMELTSFHEMECLFELKKNRETRTLLQNNALHKFFEMIATVLNEQGREYENEFLKGLKMSSRFTMIIIKETLWKPIQFALFGIESTTKIDTKQINDISDVIIKYFGEQGIKVYFPSKEMQALEAFIKRENEEFRRKMSKK